MLDNIRIYVVDEHIKYANTNAYDIIHTNMIFIDLILEIVAFVCALILFPIVSEYSAKLIQFIFHKITKKSMPTKTASMLGVSSALFIFIILIFLYLEWEVRVLPFLN